MIRLRSIITLIILLFCTSIKQPQHVQAQGQPHYYSPVIVGFLSPTPQKVCLYKPIKLDFYVIYLESNFYQDPKTGKWHTDPAWLGPTQGSASVSAVYGAVKPSKVNFAYAAKGKLYKNSFTYTANQEGDDTVTVNVTVNGKKGSASMVIPNIITCKIKLKSTTDANPFGALGQGIMQVGGTNIVTAQAKITKGGSIEGEGTETEFMYWDISAAEGNCIQNQPWEGSTSVTITGDSSSGDDMVALTVNSDPYKTNAVNWTCTDTDGNQQQANWPGGSIPAFAQALNPIPIEGGTITQIISVGPLQYEMIITATAESES
jgi:hypothetical protein